MNVAESGPRRWGAPRPPGTTCFSRDSDPGPGGGTRTLAVSPRGVKERPEAGAVWGLPGPPSERGARPRPPGRGPEKQVPGRRRGQLRGALRRLFRFPGVQVSLPHRSANPKPAPRRALFNSHEIRLGLRPRGLACPGLYRRRSAPGALPEPPPPGPPPGPRAVPRPPPHAGSGRAARTGHTARGPSRPASFAWLDAARSSPRSRAQSVSPGHGQGTVPCTPHRSATRRPPTHTGKVPLLPGTRAAATSFVGASFSSALGPRHLGEGLLVVRVTTQNSVANLKSWAGCAPGGQWP